MNIRIRALVRERYGSDGRFVFSQWLSTVHSVSASWEASVWKSKMTDYSKGYMFFSYLGLKFN